ncbi:molybdopterin-dependent oxidoreductase [Paracoccus aestuariivivens]|uniref:Molybdopterin-dependent oxidoreductase n=1 Tax=Paracoccus aestuariivivens TaxID=1820333 RepID=A0A6L6JAR2_9RHOB|nr:molybdopterin-dependent oxidoreductase [Paracoccus aestuariivivens]MTH79202.1 molybdopterin-dependent oxidoreductase [Paracoccus aestuariivivens]
MKTLRSLAALLVGMCVAGMSFAGTLPAPTGEVILTISGSISNTNDGDTAKFDREMLEKIGMVAITTSTPWYDEKTTFEGVPFKAVLDLVGAKGTIIDAIALNDYETEIPMSDTQDTGVILAMKMNGANMEIRDKGPIFVVYPYDSSATLQTQTYYARSAWQVSRLIIK